MKKKNLLLSLMLLLGASGVVGVYSFRPVEISAAPKLFKIMDSVDQTGCPNTFSCDLFDGCYGSGWPYPSPPICASLPYSVCPMVWKVPNFVWTRTGTTVTFTQLGVCYLPSPTPPWTSFSKIAYLREPSIIPSSTKVFNATANNGAIFQCTVYTNGDWYIQKTSGTDPGKGMSLSGSYTL